MTKDKTKICANCDNSEIDDRGILICVDTFLMTKPNKTCQFWQVKKGVNENASSKE